MYTFQMRGYIPPLACHSNLFSKWYGAGMWTWHLLPLKSNQWYILGWVFFFFRCLQLILFHLVWNTYIFIGLEQKWEWLYSLKIIAFTWETQVPVPASINMNHFMQSGTVSTKEIESQWSLSWEMCPPIPPLSRDWNLGLPYSRWASRKIGGRHRYHLACHSVFCLGPNPVGMFPECFPQWALQARHRGRPLWILLEVRHCRTWMPLHWLATGIWSTREF